MTRAVRVVAGEEDVNGAAVWFSEEERRGRRRIRYDARLDLWRRPRYRTLIGWIGERKSPEGRAWDGVGGHSLARKEGEAVTG